MMQGNGDQHNMTEREEKLGMPSARGCEGGGPRWPKTQLAISRVLNALVAVTCD